MDVKERRLSERRGEKAGDNDLNERRRGYGFEREKRNGKTRI